jgi:thiol-disulfide isomerase/thioredoxin
MRITTHLYLFFLLVATQAIFATPIKFETGNWKSIKEKAKKENKYIFVDTYAEWCGPCKWMSENVFTNSEVGSYYNTNFINYKIDAEKEEGLEFAVEFRVEAYPTLLYFSPEGKLVHQLVGGADADNLIRIGQAALNPDKQLFTLKARYDSGDRTKEFLYNYATALLESNQDYSEPANTYLGMLSTQEWAEVKNWEAITKFLTDINSPIYQDILNNQSDYEAKHGGVAVTEFLQNTLFANLEKIIKVKDTVGLKRSKEIIRKINPNDAEIIVTKIDMFYYADDQIKGFEALSKYLDLFCTDHAELSEAAWMYYEETTDVKKLEKALRWAEKSVAIKKEWHNLDTQAHLLYKLGKIKEATKVANEAIAVGKIEGTDTRASQELLQLIKTKNNGKKN